VETIRGTICGEVVVVDQAGHRLHGQRLKIIYKDPKHNIGEGAQVVCECIDHGAHGLSAFDPKLRHPKASTGL